MSLMNLLTDKKAQETVTGFMESLTKELEGINMALRDLCDKKERELEILKKRCKLE